MLVSSHNHNYGKQSIRNTHLTSNNITSTANYNLNSVNPSTTNTPQIKTSTTTPQYPPPQSNVSTKRSIYNNSKPFAHNLSNQITLSSTNSHNPTTRTRKNNVHNNSQHQEILLNINYDNLRDSND
jgi:hypothetical protein